MPETWRLILDGPLEGRENMAVDTAMLMTAESVGCLVPTLRMYGWNCPTISIGYRQNISDFIGFGAPVVRRITGGRAVVHATELTYSVVAGLSHPLFSGGIGASYREISSCIVDALGSFGISSEMNSREMSQSRTSERSASSTACFSSPSRHEVLVLGKKIAGSAQRRFSAAFLQHGSVLVDIDRVLNERVFGPKLIGSMTCANDHACVTMNELTASFVESFKRRFDIVFEHSSLSSAEQAVKSALLSSADSGAEPSAPPRTQAG